MNLPLRPASTDPQRSASSDELRFGMYLCTRELGRGGMGIVYEGLHEQTGHRAAIKTVQHIAPSQLSSIRREIHVLSRLSHPSIVNVLASGVHGDVPWYAMELLDGSTLEDKLLVSQPQVTTYISQDTCGLPTDESALFSHAESLTYAVDFRHTSGATGCPLEEILRLGIRLCSPLAYLHSQGVVHRDLKPSNIFLRESGQVVLVDFGLTHQATGGECREELLTIEGPIAGTSSYMAPEQLRGELLDPRSDLYALGCVLYQLATGMPPFSGTRHQVISQHLHAKPVDPRSINSAIPSALSRLILRLLAKRPRERIGHASDVARSLAELLSTLYPSKAEKMLAAGELQISTPRYHFRPQLRGREQCQMRLESWLSMPCPRPLTIITGSAGMGKTRLASEAASHARRQRFRVIKGCCSPQAKHPGMTDNLGAGPLHPFRPALQELADDIRTRSLDLHATELEGVIALLVQYEPALAGLLGENVRAPSPLPDARAEQLRLHTWLARALRELSALRPVLLILDDLQWADELTLQFLQTIACGNHQLGDFAILCTCREPKAFAEDRLSSQSLSYIRLTPLRNDDINGLVADMLGVDQPPAPIVEVLHATADGNPYYVAEYLNAAMTACMGTEHQLEQAVEVLPRSLSDLVSWRLARLDSRAQRLLTIAALLGQDFESEVLGETANLSQADFFEETARLLARGVFEQEAHGKLCMRHETLREQLLGRLTIQERQQIHRSIACALETRSTSSARELALHWEGADMPDKAYPWLIRAALRAKLQIATREARQFFERAFALTSRLTAPGKPDEVSETQIATTYLQVLYDCGDYNKTWETGTQTLRSLGIELPGKRLSWVARIIREAAIQLAVHTPFRKYQSTKPTEQLQDIFTCLNILGVTSLVQSDKIRLVCTSLIAANHCRTRASCRGEAQVLANLALVVGIAGRQQLATSYLERAYACSKLHNHHDLQRVRSADSLIALCRGDWARLEALRKPALQIALEIGDLRTEAQIAIFNCAAATLRGLAAPALEVMQGLISRVQAAGYVVEETHLLASRIHAHLLAGDPTQAELDFEQLDELIEKTHDPVASVHRDAIHAWSAWQRDDLDACYQSANRALSSLITSPSGSPGYCAPLLRLPAIFLALHDSNYRPATNVPLLESASVSLSFLRRVSRLQPVARASVALYRGHLAVRSDARRTAMKHFRRALVHAQNRQLPLVEACARLELHRMGCPNQDVDIARIARTLADNRTSLSRLPASPWHCISNNFAKTTSTTQ